MILVMDAWQALAPRSLSRRSQRRGFAMDRGKRVVARIAYFVVWLLCLIVIVCVCVVEMRRAVMTVGEVIELVSNYRYLIHN